MPDNAGLLRKLIRLALIAACLAEGLLILVLALAGNAQPSGNFLSLGWDKANHFAAYLLFTATSRLAFPKIPIPVMIFCLILFGSAIELLQPLWGRELNPLDLLANAAGIAAGLALIESLRFLKPKEACADREN